MRRRLVAAALTWWAADTAASAAHAIQSAPAPRQIFDQMARHVREARAEKPCDNTFGGIAWGNSYELDAYLEMYEATGDRTYLDHFVELADQVVAARADRMGEPDFQGWLRRGWLTGGHYTWGMPVVLLDATGAPALELVTSLNSYNNLLVIEVVPGTDGKFTVSVHDRKNDRMSRVWRDLTIADVESRINPAPGKVGPLQVRRLGRRPPVAYAPFTPPTAKTVLHGHHTGKIITPLARFAAVVKSHPELADLAAKAAEYLRCAEETIAELEQTWVDLGDRGYYVFERGIPFWGDGVPEPHNTLAATGTAFVWLADAADNPLYRRRAEQLARFIRGNLEPRPDGTWMYHYWFGAIHDGWKPEDKVSQHTPAWAGQKTPEDISHLQLTVRFMTECTERGIVFTAQDLSRMARTFNDRLYVETSEGGSLHASMAGAESTRRKLGAFDDNIYGFMLLAPTDRLVFDRCYALYVRRFAEGTRPSTLYGWGVLNHMAAVLAKAAPSSPPKTSPPAGVLPLPGHEETTPAKR